MGWGQEGVSWEIQDAKCTLRRTLFRPIRKSDKIPSVYPLTSLVAHPTLCTNACVNTTFSKFRMILSTFEEILVVA